MHEMEQTEPLLVPAVEVVSKPGRIERLRVPTWALVRPAGDGRRFRGDNRKDGG
jgi:hypothetical protein